MHAVCMRLNASHVHRIPLLTFACTKYNVLFIYLYNCTGRSYSLFIYT